MAGNRREEILRAAHELAAERGLGGLTVRAVAARAGIGPSTLRHYFPTQQDLYRAVVGEQLDHHLDDLRISDATVPPATRLTECFAQFLPPSSDRVPELESWLRLYASASGTSRSEDAARLLGALTRTAADRVDRWLGLLEGEGALDPADRAVLGTTLLALVDGLSLALLGPGPDLAPARAREVIADVVGRYVRA